MKLFLFALFVFLQAVPALAKETIGSMDPTSYPATSETTEHDGQLRLASVWTNIVYDQFGRSYLGDACSSEIFINGLKIAKPCPSFLTKMRMQGDIEYLKINLPAGKYSAVIKMNNSRDFEFEFIIQKGKILSIHHRRDGGYDSNIDYINLVYNFEKIENTLLIPIYTTKIDDKNYKIIRDSMSNSAEEFDSISKINAEEAADKKEKNRLISEQKENNKEKLAKEWRDSFVISELQKGINKIEQEERIKSLKAEEEERIKYKQAEDDQKIIKEKELIANEDDAKCKSFGAKFGTEPYINCRIAFTKSRQEKEDIEIKNKEILTNIEAIKRQADIQQSQRQAEARASEERRVNELQLYQQQLAEEKKRRDRADNLDRSQRWFDLAYKFSQPTQGSVPVPLIPMPKTTSCVINGNYVNCRTP